MRASVKPSELLCGSGGCRPCTAALGIRLLLGLLFVSLVAACGGDDNSRPERQVTGSEKAAAGKKRSLVTASTSSGSTPGARQLFRANPSQDPLDLNGDGKGDLLWYGSASGESVSWLMDGMTPIGNGATLLRHPTYEVIGTADLNGDGTSDLIWHDPTAGETTAWLMNGNALSSGAQLLKNSSFKVVGAPDLNGDGKSDLLWHNPTTGETAAWIMDGLSLRSGGTLLTSFDFRVVAMPDLNGDGKTDLVWHNQSTGETVAWLMDGINRTAGLTLLNHPQFQVTATPDLNGDGKSDLLWRNPTNGLTVAWLMNGLSLIGGNQLLADTSFEVIATPDFNGDRQSDLLWYSASTGQTVIWLMDGMNITQGVTVLANTAYRVVGTSDLNGDGKADLQWHNRGSGETVAWLMDGVSYLRGGGLLRTSEYALLTAQIPASPAPSAPPTASSVVPLYSASTALEPVTAFVRNDGVVVTRFGDRGRDRHAKDITMSDHYDHYLAHYWEYRTARVQLEDYVPKGQSLIRATFITEAELGAREFRVWYWGQTTTGQFHFNPQKDEVKVSPNETGVVYHGRGTWNNNFEKVSDTGTQYKYSLDIVNKWENGGQFQRLLQVGTNMEFEISQFLLAPPAGARLNYYGTSYVYVIGQPGLAPFEWQRGVNKAGGANDGTPIPPAGLSGGSTTLGYNYTNEPAGRFMQMATNLSPGNAQTFVQGRRVHHTNFEDGSHDERHDNPIWVEQVGKAGSHYINHSCAECHVRNGRALVADVGGSLDKWVFKVGDANGAPDPLIGSVLQPEKTGASDLSEGKVTLGAWTNHLNGLRSPNYVFSQSRPARFSARIAPQLVGMGLLDAVAESTILERADPDDLNGDGISGRAALVTDPVTGQIRLGRFGYKAGAFSLAHQVASALNTDIGVMTRMLPNPDCGSRQSACGSAGQELCRYSRREPVQQHGLLRLSPAHHDHQPASPAG